MKVCRSCKLEKPLLEFHNHPTNKDGKQGLCKACHHAANMNWLHKNHAELRPAMKAYHAKHYVEHKEHYQSSMTEHYAQNYPAYYEKMRRRQAAKICATPNWVDKDELLKIYTEAAKLRAAGEDVHVDHIIPLRGKKVCGLHVPWNLQIITAVLNKQKSNYFEV